VTVTEQYDFREQLKKGEGGEKIVSSILSSHYKLQGVSKDVQRYGIDRIVETKLGTFYSLEIKTDWTAGKTGNAFIETISVSKTKKPGWGYSCCAQVIAYFVPDIGLIYMINPIKLKLIIPEWAKNYPIRKIPNRDYFTEGLLVPLKELDKIIFYVVTLKDL